MPTACPTCGEILYSWFTVWYKLGKWKIQWAPRYFSYGERYGQEMSEVSIPDYSLSVDFCEFYELNTECGWCGAGPGVDCAPLGCDRCFHRGTIAHDRGMRAVAAGWTKESKWEDWKDFD